MKKLLRPLKVIISGAILCYIFYIVDFNLLLSQFFLVTPVIISLGLFTLLIQSALSSLKWKIILSAEGKDIPYLYLMKSYLIGNFMSLFLPSSFGGDIYRVYALGKHNTDYMQNTASVLFDRLSGLFALTSLSVISFSFFYQDIINYYFISAYLIGIFVFWIMSSQKAIMLIGRFENRFVRMFTQILKSFSRYRNDKKVFLGILLISFVFQNNIVLLNRLYSYGLNIDIPLHFLYMVIPLIYLTEALPISINGLGVREGAFLFFFTQAGYSKEQSLALALLVISIRYMFTIVAGGSLFLKEFLIDNKNKTPLV